MKLRFYIIKVWFKIGKTDLTKELEYKIFKATNKQGVFGCFEVTIGWFGKERVDYITYDTKGIWRCYEIKVSKSDFYSKAHNTFAGHFNYYVMPQELYNIVKDNIPKHIGVYIGADLIKRPKKQTLNVDEQILKNSLIRSLSREVDKQILSGSTTLIEYKNRQIRQEKNKADKYYRMYWDLLREVQDKYGNRWNKE